MIYIDFILLTTLLLPMVLRRTIISAWLTVATTSIDVTQTNSTALYDEIGYRLKFNELKIYIEHYLNDRHDPENRLIYIEDVEQEENNYIFNNGESNEAFYLFNTTGEDPDGEPPYELNQVYLFNDEEIDDIEDFIVYVPTGLVYNIEALKLDVNSFKLPGMKYSVVES